jgi:hypothetical protein
VFTIDKKGGGMALIELAPDVSERDLAQRRRALRRP